jgi:acyl carrier protein
VGRVTTEAPDARFIELVRARLKYLPPGADIDLDCELRDLGLDSLAAIDLLLDLEEAYGAALPDQFLNAETFRTARTLWAAVATNARV